MEDLAGRGGIEMAVDADAWNRLTCDQKNCVKITAIFVSGGLIGYLLFGRLGRMYF